MAAPNQEQEVTDQDAEEEKSVAQDYWARVPAAFYQVDAGRVRVRVRDKVASEVQCINLV